jgi:hypothetical protein
VARRRPRSENLELYNTPALRSLNGERRKADDKRTAQVKAQEEGRPFRRKAVQQHPTSEEFEAFGRVEPRDQ